MPEDIHCSQALLLWSGDHTIAPVHPSIYSTSGYWGQRWVKPWSLASVRTTAFNNREKWTNINELPPCGGRQNTEVSITGMGLNFTLATNCSNKFWTPLSLHFLTRKKWGHYYFVPKAISRATYEIVGAHYIVATVIVNSFVLCNHFIK